MQIIQRQKAILDYLVQSNGFITAKQLAAKFMLSEKTVYRDIGILEELLAPFTDIIIKVSGKGYQINYAKYLEHVERLNSLLMQESSLSIDERRNQILLNLLLEAPHETSINKLSEEYFVSPASIVNDLKKIEKIVVTANLTLVRSNTGTYIQGAENAIRQQLNRLYNQAILSVHDSSHFADALDQRNFTFLQKYFRQEDIQVVKEALDEAEENLGFIIKEPYYLNVFTHLLITIKRLRESTIEVEALILMESDIDISIEKVAINILKKISAYLQMKLPDNELYYIYSFLASFRTSKDDGLLSIYEVNPNKIYVQFVNDLLKQMGEKLGIDFTQDSQLKKLLLLHAKPMINRMKYGIATNNPLTLKIKNEFAEVYQLTRKVTQEIVQHYQLNEISEGEVAYLTLYLQDSVERLQEILNVLIVCSTGIGTSHLLMNRVERAFPDWQIIDVISAGKINLYKERTDIDLVLTTVHLEDIQLPTLMVSTFFGEKDVAKVFEQLRK